jgi:glutamate-1-semialdehyde 2,1-aminomutase
MSNRYESERVYKRSCKVIPGGVNSPVRSFPGLNQVPLVAASAHADTVIDVDGKCYIDYCGSWGALIHGHSHPQIIESAQRRLSLGSSFGITTPIEAQLAERVVELLPFVEKIRFVSSGTEATMSAIRVARGYTGRDLIFKFAGHYHGHSDIFLVQAGSGVARLTRSSHTFSEQIAALPTEIASQKGKDSVQATRPRPFERQDRRAERASCQRKCENSGLSTRASSLGVPQGAIEQTICLPYNDLDICKQAFQKYGQQLAAVILEPIAANMGVIEPARSFIGMLREETEKCGALLIFDEVITGFRIALGGAAEYFGVVPDLACYGKIVGGGFPAAAFGGRGEIMDVLAPLGPVYQAGTLSGNPVAMEAGYQSVSLCTTPNFYQTLKEKTDLITGPIQELIKRKKLNLCLHQAGSLFTLFCGIRVVRNFEDVKRCDTAYYNTLFRRLFQQGVYLVPSQFEANFVSMAHTTEHLLFTRDCLLDALNMLSTVSSKMSTVNA